MIALLENNLDSVAKLCDTYRVESLYAFGSSLRDGEFDPESSDLDFVVAFQRVSPEQHYESYFGLLYALQELFDREIDLIEYSALENPYIIESINATRRLIYGPRVARVSV